jgi:hypothetical protein
MFQISAKLREEIQDRAGGGGLCPWDTIATQIFSIAWIDQTQSTGHLISLQDTISCAATTRNKSIN